MKTLNKKSYKTGLYIGKFFPMHLGHVSAIHTLEAMCEKVFVVFYNDKNAETRLKKELGKEYEIDLRIMDARSVFHDNREIVIEKIDIPADIKFPADYQKIKAMIQEITGDTIDVQIFGAEERGLYEPYKYASKSILAPMYEVKDVSGKRVSLHASLIRSDYSSYKKYLSVPVSKTLDSL